jgi:hypothetical protein
LRCYHCAGYGDGLTLEAIKEAVVHLSEAERQQFADWFDELEEQAWDKQIECDSSPGGRAEHLMAKVEADIAAGKFHPMKGPGASRATRLLADKAYKYLLRES